MKRSPTYFGRMPNADVAPTFAALAKTIDPKSDLEYGSPFELLVAVVLSAHATDKSVNLATRKLFPLANTPKAILALGVEGLTPYIRHIGLYRGKAQRVIDLCRLLIERHGGEVPRERAALEDLPGVGRKTANVILNIVFGEPTIAVDTHVQRVANRLGLAKTTAPLRTEEVLLARTPAQYLQHAHHYLILHGRYCCTARAPRCPTCPVRTWCRFPDKTPG